ncbi:MAG: hypothetical protein D084_Lepto4C00104G0002 [Leptospirillum sp. Group IV 'UBA BS']|nr:MAG: hypothetical protein D084_Lepto4C00104G0002 [Leptospirillum sp. Group IV 'UBA BS']
MKLRGVVVAASRKSGLRGPERAAEEVFGRPDGQGHLVLEGGVGPGPDPGEAKNGLGGRSREGRKLAVVEEAGSGGPSRGPEIDRSRRHGWLRRGNEGVGMTVIVRPERKAVKGGDAGWEKRENVWRVFWRELC